jgi:arylsulfatase A-like enzyme
VAGSLSVVRNVLLLTADSLRQDYAEETSTALADLTDGTYFTNAVATASNTASAIPGLAAGRYVDTSGTTGACSGEDPATLFEAFRNAGYRINLWTENPLFSNVRDVDKENSAGIDGRGGSIETVRAVLDDALPRTITKRGERAYFERIRPLARRFGLADTYYTPAARLNRAATRWLGTVDSNYFFWIHYMDTHHPYEPSESALDPDAIGSDEQTTLESRSRLAALTNGATCSDAELDHLRALYAATCEEFGESLCSFVHDLIAAGYFDPERDLLVFTADHGECLSPDRGLMGHVPAAFWEELLHVPLIISHPAWGRGRIEDQVSLIDVFPTVLDAAGLAVPATADGTPRRTPDEMAVKYAFAAARTLRPGDTNAVVRAVRRRNGTKLFGRFAGEVTTVFSTYEPADPTVESVLHEADATGEPPARAPHHESWTTLCDQLSELGGPVSDTSGTDTVAEHRLRALGYVE